MDENTIERLGSNDVVKIAGWVFVALSATTTFGFFFTFLPSIVPVALLGDTWLAGIFSGVVGVILFEGASLTWLRAYLSGSDTEQQRTIALQSSKAAMAGGAVASFAWIVLSGLQLVSLSTSSQQLVGWLSLLAVAVVTVLHFVNNWRFAKNSKLARDQQRLAARAAKIQKEEEKQQNLLDDLIAEKAGKKIAERAEYIAEQIANRIANAREREELARSQATQPAAARVPAHENTNTNLLDVDYYGGHHASGSNDHVYYANGSGHNVGGDDFLANGDFE